MQQNHNTIKTIGTEGRKNVLKKFDVDKMCQTTFTEYKKLIYNLSKELFWGVIKAEMYIKNSFLD